MKYQEVIQTLIKLNIRRRLEVDPMETWSMMGGLNYLKQWATVRVDIGRAIGKTSFIKDNFTTDDVVFVPTERMQREAYRGCSNVLVTKNAAYEQRLRSICAPKVIYFDEPRLIEESLGNREGLDRLYAHTMSNPFQTYVLLGA